MNSSAPLIWKAKDNIFLHDEIQLKQSTFEQHVLNDNNRLELKGEESTLKNIVESPTYIVKDKDYEERIHYGGLRFLKNISCVHWVGVCVDTKASPPDVCTAMSCRKIPTWVKEEFIIYDSTKPNSSEL